MHEFRTGGYCPSCKKAKENCTCFADYAKSIGIMDARLKNVKLIDELDFTFVEVDQQLIEDEKRYGDTWKNRGLRYNGQSQEERFFDKMTEYMNNYREFGVPINWKKVIGEAHIAMVREKFLK